MYRTIRCAAAALFIASQAIAQEKVSLPSTDADLTGGAPTTISGYFYKPAGAGPFAAVVSMPGCDGVLGESDDILDKKGEIHPMYAQWGEILSSKGYLVLPIDSLQPRVRNRLCEDFGIGLSREMTRDAVGGMNYLRSRPDVRPDSIAIMGQSYGGMATLFTTSKGALPNNISVLHEALDFPAIEVYLRQGIAADPEGPTFEASMAHMLADHTSGEDVGRIAQEAGVKTLVLSHIAPPSVSDASWHAAAAKFFKGEIIVGHDLMVI
jgi:dienelactone hydrolase